VVHLAKLRQKFLDYAAPLPPAAPVADALHALLANPAQVGLELFGGAEGFYGSVAAGQVAVAEKPVHAAVARLAQVDHRTVFAAFFAGHQVVARSGLHGPLAEAALPFAAERKTTGRPTGGPGTLPCHAVQKRRVERIFFWLFNTAGWPQVAQLLSGH
jgi:hypothetical protein